jgi:16S rRNA (cytosine967-C5)-methyltransferase
VTKTARKTSRRRPAARDRSGPPRRQRPGRSERAVEKRRAASGEPRPLRHDLVDAVVLEAYGLVHDQGWLADRALERVLRRERRLFAAERRAAAEAAYGMIRWRGFLEWAVGLGHEAPEHAVRYAAWLAAFGGEDAGAATRRLGVPPASIAGLEGASARLGRIADPVERFSVEQSLPRWIAARLVQDLGEGEARLLATALNARAPLTIRANLLKGDRDDLARRLAEEGVVATPTVHSPWGLVLDGHANAFALKAFQEGRFEIQDEGSQLLALAAGARPNHVVVDACAGAGGKTLALAMEMRNKGTLWAVDTDADRLSEARRRARRNDVHNVRVRVVPGTGAEADEAVADLAGADRVLADVPCSGLGTLRRKPDARWRLAPGDPARFAALQREIAARAARLVKPGGRFAYATCSLAREENEDVAAFLLAEVPGLAPFPIASALGEERARALGASGHELRLWPHRHGTDGFFLAMFERRG